MSDGTQSPKHIRAQKDGKAPLEYLVTEVLDEDAEVHKHGADKYGVRNWLVDEICASTYEGAMMRHLLAWIRGEDLDPDTGKPHLAHLRACCAVVRSAEMHGTLIDDRNRRESKSGEPESMTGAEYTGAALDSSPRYEGYPTYRCSSCGALKGDEHDPECANA